MTILDKSTFERKIKNKAPVAGTLPSVPENASTQDRPSRTLDAERTKRDVAALRAAERKRREQKYGPARISSTTETYRSGTYGKDELRDIYNGLSPSVKDDIQGGFAPGAYEHGAYSNSSMGPLRVDQLWRALCHFAQPQASLPGTPRSSNKRVETPDHVDQVPNTVDARVGNGGVALISKPDVPWE
ncbi:hypothetical protein M8818_001532 [Zalaria obscura]|uniref:Uncharacterized protein n=1 Tax=Zalaria obscura TaxID=2024903 RepID=A0ACC3SK11_9PEZI